MTLNLTVTPQLHTDFTPRITVVGVGGGGTNAVDNMIAMNLQGVEFIVANTDAQQLVHSRADRRIQLGPHITQGLGAGAKPEIGRMAAEEAADEISRHLDGAHMVFITAGMGGGTGTGAAPVIARMARERGILTVGVVTKPFTFEGSRRAKAAEAGIADLTQYVDTLIVIPNQNLFRLANDRTGWKEAFKMADNVLYMGVRGVTDLMVAPGMVNLDFADIRTVMGEMGKAMMGTGEAEGENRAIRAAEAAISNPLLEDTCMAGARGLLINITGGEDMTLFEVDQAANRIREEVDEDANIIFGSAVDDNLAGKIRVSVVATGMDGASIAAIEPKMERRPLQAPPLRAPEVTQAPAQPAEPVRSIYATPAAQTARTYEPAAYTPPPASEPQPHHEYVRPTAAITPPPAPVEESQADLYAPPEPVITQRPLITPAAQTYAEPAPISRIVDPMVADEEEDEPLFGETVFEDRRPQKSGGFLSLFGSRPRYDAPAAAPAPRAPARGSALPVESAAPQSQADSQEDLEIPSFLRRLAN